MNSILLMAASNTSTKGVTVSEGIPIFKWLYMLFGECMGFLMDLLHNQYFLAIIIFTVLTRLVLLPLNIRQQKTSAKSMRLQPKIQKIQKKYPDPRDRNKVQQETAELYSREGHNPMNMGCGPMLFQMVFLMGIIGIIYYPISYVLGVKTFSANANDIANVILPIYRDLVGDSSARIQYFQLNILEHFDVYRDALAENFPKIFTPDVCAEISTYRNSMTLFGLDMTAVPHWKDGIIVIIPILCLVTSLASTFISSFIQKKNNPAMGQQMGQMMMMMIMMPFFSFYISFKVTAAVGFYWIISNLVAIFQQLFLYRVFPAKKIQAHNMIESTIERRSREENIKKTK